MSNWSIFIYELHNQLGFPFTVTVRIKTCDPFIDFITHTHTTFALVSFLIHFMPQLIYLSNVTSPFPGPLKQVCYGRPRVKSLGKSGLLFFGCLSACGVLPAPRESSGGWKVLHHFPDSGLPSLDTRFNSAQDGHAIQMWCTDSRLPRAVMFQVHQHPLDGLFKMQIPGPTLQTLSLNLWGHRVPEMGT